MILNPGNLDFLIESYDLQYFQWSRPILFYDFQGTLNPQEKRRRARGRRENEVQTREGNEESINFYLV
jgi:hypothetical protein